ncbi:unnamed protein product [Bursaphelenchus okinawaensis]|uniref:Solute-binding protein family 3/N-terminal domain-containing protein n=1 Tax=Bursaphelenchus okinawaensis TaxID=465554 RepID=A0A811K745_9BILA|nr:unnamed protein product [Bursaphelenchus okinawaensis]CAG9092815.1 unnamed protein product [Bursaphelenchus okinawaensis]
MTVEPVVIGATDSELVHVPLIVDGHPNGLPKLLFNGSVDLIAAPFQTTKNRAALFSFSEPLYTLSTTMLMHDSANLNSDIWSFFRTYTNTTWNVILIALFLQISFCVLIRFFEANVICTQRISVLESSWQMLRLQLMQPEKIYFKSLAGRFSIMIFSLVQCAVLLGVFSSWILASIIRDAAPHTPFESMDKFIKGLAARKYYMVSAEPDTWFFEEVNQSQVFPFKQLHSALQQNPLRRATKTRQALEAVVNDGAVVFMQSDSDTYYTSVKFCNLNRVYQDMPVVTAYLMFRKGWPLAALFNQTIVENRMHITRILRKYKHLLAESRAICRARSLHSPLSIYPYLGLLIICTGAITVSVFVLFLENFLYRANKVVETMP